MRSNEVRVGQRVRIVGGRGDGREGLICKIRGGRRQARTCDIALFTTDNAPKEVLEKIGPDYLEEIPEPKPN